MFKGYARVTRITYLLDKYEAMNELTNGIRKEEVRQEVFDLYDDYAHNRIDRNTFMQRLSMYAVGGVTVASLMSFLMPDYKGRLQIPKDDPRIKSSYIDYESPKGGGKIRGLLSMPAKFNGKLGGVVVVHENRGLNPHIEDVGRRVALAGFLSLAPDALAQSAFDESFLFQPV